MPVPDTKYNLNDDGITTNFQKDISNASFTYGNHILTCDISDTLTIDGEPYKIYVDSKAAFLMHPFSQVRNCTTKFNNEKQAYKNQNPISVPMDMSSSLAPIQTQKIIQKQVKVTASLYTMNLGSLYINNEDLSHNTLRYQYNASDRSTPHGLKTSETKNTSIKPNYGVDVKHNSYDRYLGRKKSQYLKTQSTPAPTPLMGNKTRNFSLINCQKTC